MRFDDQNGMCARFFGHGFQNLQTGIKLLKRERNLEVFFGQNVYLHGSLWNIRVFVWKTVLPYARLRQLTYKRVLNRNKISAK